MTDKKNTSVRREDENRVNRIKADATPLVECVECTWIGAREKCPIVEESLVCLSCGSSDIVDVVE